MLEIEIEWMKSLLFYDYLAVVFQSVVEMTN